MWIFTEDGFFSTVVDKDDPNLLAVRTRDSASLLAFCADRKIDPADRSAVEMTPDRDYPMRVRVDKYDWAAYLAEYVNRMKYDDFKGHCVKSGWPRKWINRLSDIWFLMATEWQINSQDER